MTIHSNVELAGMTEIGRLVGLALREMSAAAQAGMTTAELDNVGAAFLRRYGARSAPQFTYDFPGFNCISLNEQVVHGVPGPRRLREGDVVKIDVTAELGGYIADAAVTLVLPPATQRAFDLRDCAAAAFDCALGAVRAGGRLYEIGRAVESEVARRGFSVVRELGGHGVGRAVHEKPCVLNFYNPEAREILTEGLVLAVEPIISEKRSRVFEELDGWTLRTSNRCLAAHYEHTVVVTSGKPLVLTAVDE
jgi:methionyl aminopeptidase